MFGAAGLIQRYMKEKYSADKTPAVVVSRTRFIKLCMEAGYTQAQAKLSASVSKGMGSVLRVGDQTLQCK